MDDIITLEEFKLARDKLKPFVNFTKLENLENYDNNIFLKKESEQQTNSFKWSGVLYSVMLEFEEILKHKKINFYLVTQSTGNHGIAVLWSINKMITHYTELYPEHKNLWTSVIPVIFTNNRIKKNKLDLIQNALKQFKHNNNGFIDCTHKNYECSLKARTEFLEKNEGVYLQHGGKNIMTGYGSIAFQIDEQVEKGKSIAFYASVGAGGPLGIALCLSYLRDTEIIIAQTEEYDALIKTLKHETVFVNNCDQEVGISDGIAVDKPEEYAIKIGKKIVNKMFSVKTNNVIEIINRTNLGNSVCITLEALNSYKSNKDVIVVLECEKKY